MQTLRLTGRPAGGGHPVAARRCPAQVHALQHLRPVHRLHAARPRLQGIEARFDMKASDVGSNHLCSTAGGLPTVPAKLSQEGMAGNTANMPSGRIDNGEST